MFDLRVWLFVVCDSDLPSLGSLMLGFSTFLGIWDSTGPLSEFAIVKAPLLNQVIFSNHALYCMRLLRIERKDAKFL